jgi:hypothetical protein
VDYADAFWTFGEYARRYACGPERRDTVYVGTSGGVVYLDCGPTNVMKMRRVDLGRVLYEITVVSADAWWEARMVDHVMRKSKKYLGVRLPIWVENLRPDSGDYGRALIHVEDRLYLPTTAVNKKLVYYVELPRLEVSVYLHGLRAVAADDELMKLRDEYLNLYHEYMKLGHDLPDDIRSYHEVVETFNHKLWYPNLVSVDPSGSEGKVRRYLEYVKHILRDVLLPRLREELALRRLVK